MSSKSSSLEAGKVVNSKLIEYTVDSYANGISFGQHQATADEDPRNTFALRIQSENENFRPRSRYDFTKDKPLHQLERYLMKLSSQGKLHSAHIHFGSTSDPFHPFEGKFDASIKFLELFRRYTPGHLTVQTRSPLIVIALPVFASLGKHVSINIGIETCDEQAVRRYTPGLPRIDERLKTAVALKRFGVEVNLHVTPLLPYGDWQKDAEPMAQILVDHAKHIFIQPLNDGSFECQRNLRSSPVAKRIAEDRKFHWLRRDATQPLINAINKLAPEKLLAPKREQLSDRQLKIFAA